MTRGHAAVLLVVALVLAAGPATAEPLTQTAQVYKALQAGRYGDAEGYYAKLRRERTRGADGTFLFEEFYRSGYWYSSSDPADPTHWPKVDAATRAWVAHSPRSHLAAMTRAFALAYRAQVVEVREGKWAEADALAAEARRLLDGSRDAGASDPLWHATRLRVAAAQGLPRTDVLDMIHAAVAVDPYPVRLWQEAAIALSPDGKNTDDLLWLARLAAQRTEAQEGTSMQARVIDSVFWHFGDFMASPFGGARRDWDALDRSFLDWRKRYPAGYSPDLHGALACAARDREATAAILPRVGAGTRKEIWNMLGGKDYMARCREWATPVVEKPSV